MLKALDIDGNLIYIDNATPSFKYRCQICMQPLLQKRGQIRAHHFAHLSSHGKHSTIVPCSDKWNYDMSEWHINWQRRFDPVDIERVVSLGSVKHIADVLVNNIVLEFQHSSISIEEFRERNAFYTSSGRKVIWVFDLIDELNSQKISSSEANGNHYTWSYAKKLSRSVNIDNELATIYFQFSSSENDEHVVLERVSKSYDGFRQFYTDKNQCFSISEFVELVKENNNQLFPRPKEKEAPNELSNGQSIFDLWKQTFSGMIVENIYNKKTMIINGRNGQIYRKDWKENGRIIGKYVTYLPETKMYGNQSSYYVVKDEDKKIWRIIKKFEKQTLNIKQINEDVPTEGVDSKANAANNIKNEETNSKLITDSFNNYLRKHDNEEERPTDIRLLIFSNLKSGSVLAKKVNNNKTYYIKWDKTSRFFMDTVRFYEIDETTGGIGKIVSAKTLFSDSTESLWIRPIQNNTFNTK